MGLARILLAVVFVGGSSFASPSAAPASTHLTATTAAGKIVIARGDGSDRRVLGDGWESYVSPDGARVAVSDFDPDLGRRRGTTGSSSSRAPAARRRTCSRSSA